MALVKLKTQIPHVYRIDLYNEGLAHECAVLSTDKFGNTYYIKISDLDEIDRTRIGKILQHRYINQLPLWDVMSQTTLKNGMNALDYFQQLVKAITPAGKPFTPKAGAGGYSVNQQMELQARNAAQKDAHDSGKRAEQELAAAKALIAKSEGK